MRSDDWDKKRWKDVDKEARKHYDGKSNKIEDGEYKGAWKERWEHGAIDPRNDEWETPHEHHQRKSYEHRALAKFKKTGQCKSCDGKIALTDVQGHYSGECKGCRWEFQEKIDDYHGRGLT